MTLYTKSLYMHILRILSTYWKRAYNWRMKANCFSIYLVCKQVQDKLWDIYLINFFLLFIWLLTEILDKIAWMKKGRHKHESEIYAYVARFMFYSFYAWTNKSHPRFTSRPPDKTPVIIRTLEPNECFSKG